MKIEKGNRMKKSIIGAVVLTVATSVFAAAEVVINLDYKGIDRQIKFQFNDFTEAVEFVKEKAEDKLESEGYCDPKINTITIRKVEIKGLN